MVPGTALRLAHDALGTLMRETGGADLAKVAGLGGIQEGLEAPQVLELCIADEREHGSLKRNQTKTNDKSKISMY